MLASALIDLLGLIAIAGVCGAMAFLAYRIEPHWVARNGTRFLTVAQELDQFGLPLGRKHEVRVHVEPGEDSLRVSRRSLRNPSSGVWVVHSKVPNPPRGRVVYILKKVTSDQEVDKMALRVPERSKMIPRLDELLEATGEEATLKQAMARRAAEASAESEHAAED